MTLFYYILFCGERDTAGAEPRASYDQVRDVLTAAPSQRAPEAHVQPASHRTGGGEWSQFSLLVSESLALEK